MPMLWKKTRVGRISQMVADLQSPKRGGSLVVQTGFPTSLIDLFVKNRDRMRKQSRKQQRENTNSEKSSDFDHSDRVSDPIMSSSEQSSGHLSVLARPSSAKTEDLNQEDADFEISGGTELESCELFEDCVGGGDGDWGSMMVAAAKVFVVLVLALCTTKLAVGVTLSAFLLLFLEFLGKRFVFLMIPCSNSKLALRKMVERVCEFVIFLRSDVVLRENSEGAVLEIVESEASIQEVEVIQHSNKSSSNSSVGIDEDVNQKSLIEYLIGDDKWVKVEDCDHGDELTASVCQKSKNMRNGKKRCVKMGARLINKIVPRKLRTMSKKSQARPELEQSSEDTRMEEDGLEEKGENQTEGFSMEGEKSVNSSSVFSVSSEHKCERGADEISDHCEVETSLVHSVVETKGTENKENFGYMILFSLTLAGLVGGRILALILIITWCFVLKVIKAWSRSGDVPMPMKRCPVPVKL